MTEIFDVDSICSKCNHKLVSVDGEIVCANCLTKAQIAKDNKSLIVKIRRLFGFWR